MIYEMHSEEVEELNLLEKELFHSNGIPKKEICENNVRKVVRLKHLWNKKQELKLASMN
tara:strand:+ start:264 stop:440 length:177 start_codon:yes stop_codon:yes gene_type:complete